MTRSHAKKFWGVAFFLGILIPVFANAQTAIPNRYPDLGAGARPQGMGNAFITMPGSDINGQFYNPASSDDFKQNWTYEIMDTQAEIDTKSISMVKDVKNLSKDISNATTTSGKVAAFESFFNSHVGQFSESDLRIIPFGVRTKHFTGTVIMETNSAISMRNRAFPNMQVKGTADGGAFLTYAWELFDGFQAGVAGKVLYRNDIDTTVTTGDIVAQAKLANILGYKQWNKGIGGGADLGAKYTLPLWDEWAPVVGVVWQDIGDTRFTSFHSQNGAPTRIKQSLTAAVGVHPEIGDFKLHLEVSASQLNQNMDFLLMSHAGAELEFPRLGVLKMALRAGANQGYPTGGASFDFGLFKLDLLAYGEEEGLTKREKGLYHYGVDFGFKF